MTVLAENLRNRVSDIHSVHFHASNVLKWLPKRHSGLPFIFIILCYFLLRPVVYDKIPTLLIQLTKTIEKKCSDTTGTTFSIKRNITL